MNTALITATPAAIEHFDRVLAKMQGPHVLRLSLKKSGCSGLSYVMETIEKPQDSDLPIALTQTLTLYLDIAARDYIKQTEIDFVKEGLNQHLVFRNPNQTGECGCGESFTVS